MADFDTSSYQNKVLPLNPLDNFGKAATLQNTLNQNQLFQQMFKTNKAVSDIYKRAVKPDGTLDMDQLRDEVSKNPDAAYGLAEVYKGAQGLQQGQIQTDTSALENKLKHYHAVGSFIAPLVALGDKATSTDVLHQLSAAGVAGLASPKEQGEFYAMMPRTPDNRIDESKIPAWSKQLLMTLQDRATQLQATMPAPTPVDTGSQINLMRLPQQGEPSLAGVVQKGLPPTTPVFPAGGGQPSYAGAAQGGAGQPGQPSGGTAFAANPPGFEPAMNKSGEDSATQLAALRSEVGGSANRVLQLQNASTALEGALTGKGSQKIQDVQALLVTTGMATEAQAQRVKNFDEAKKYMLGSMLSRGAGLGINTNEKLAALSGASPNTEISKLAAKDILRTNIGLEKAQQAQYAAFQNAGVPPDQFANWAAQWSTNRDLRAYTIAQAAAADRKKFVESLKPAERAKFAATLTEAVRLGILPLSDFAK